MKSTTFALLPLAVSAAVLESRQFGAANVAGVVKLQPAIRSTAQRTLTKFGPYTLNGAKGGGGASIGGMGMGDSTLAGQSYMLSIGKGFCNDNGPCTVLGGKVGVMFEDGTAATPAKGVYIHHVLTSDRTKKVPMWLSACDSPTKAATSISAMGGTGFIGTGEDAGEQTYLYTTADGKANTGFHMEKADKFLANVQLVNYNKESKKVYITYDLEFVPGKVGMNTQGLLISVTQCRGGQIKLSQTAPTNTTSGKFTVMHDGQIISARGHLHDGGTRMDLFINGKYQCSSQANYGGDKNTAVVGGKEWATISSMSYCQGPIAVKKGDFLTMNAGYDLIKHPLRKSADGHAASGVMGMFAITFAAAV